MNQQDISYALAKQVPNMVRGFRICTNYSDIVIEAGWMADQIAKQVELAMRCELLALEQDQPVAADGHSSNPASGRDQYGFKQEATLIGGTYVRHPVPQPALEASCAQSPAAACPICGQEVKCAMPAPNGSRQ